MTTLRVERLRCEYQTNPLGIDHTEPRLGWVIASEQRGQYQAAYQIHVAATAEALAAGAADLWDSGRISSADQLGVVYAGAPLRHGMECHWRVRVWNQAGEVSEWSTPAAWTMGPMAASDWHAQWIAADADVPTAEVLERMGYLSAAAAQADETKWLVVDLGQTVPVNSVRLVPIQWARVPTVFPFHLFPVRFYIELAESPDFANSRRVVDETSQDFPNPYPTIPVFTFAQQDARYVRLTVTKLSFGTHAEAVPAFAYALAQLEVLSKGENIARNCPVRVSDAAPESASWKTTYLTDGRGRSNVIAHEPQFRPAPMFRKRFRIAKDVRRALLHSSALGCYELRLNGNQIGPPRLAPQWTCYDRTVMYETHDVTDLLVKGANVLASVVGDGWYRLRRGWGAQKDTFGRNYGDSILRFLAQLEIQFRDGSVERLVTDDSWRSYRNGPVRRCSLYDGSEYDARAYPQGWDAPGQEEDHWDQALVSTPSWHPRLVAESSPAMQTIEERAPVDYWRTPSGSYIFDMGENIGGVCRLRVRGEAGARIELRHAEALDGDRRLYLDNLWGADALDTVVLGGNDFEELTPPFTYHGFRYVEVNGLPEPPTSETVTALVFASAVADTGTLSASDPRVRQLWEVIRRTYRGNLATVVTDCVARDEHLGWMGDGQNNWRSISYAFDMAGLGPKWHRDMRDHQTPAGFFTVTAPAHHSGHAPGWSDAAIVIPWACYEYYGDKRILDSCFEPAKRYLDAIETANPGLLWEHNRGLDFGDWLDAVWVSTGNAWRAFDFSAPTLPKDVLANAYWFHSTRLLSRMAGILGHDDEAAARAEKADRLRQVFLKSFVDDGKVKGDSQSAYAVALSFGLLDAPLAEQAAVRLAEAIEQHDGRLTTGISSSKHMLMMLSKTGQHQLAYRAAFHPDFPSWRYMLDSGATTIWERFDGYVRGRGFNPAPMNALNHVGFCSVGEWLWRCIIGIEPEEGTPGFERFVVRPAIGGGLTWAEGRYDSVRGPIEVRWTATEGRTTLNVTVPPNTTATIHVPTVENTVLLESGVPAERAEGVTSVKRAENTFVITAASGNYAFATQAQRA